MSSKGFVEDVFCIEVDANPEVSVVITLTDEDNRAFFQKALRSLLLQTISLLEILVVADGPIGDDLIDLIKAECHQYSSSYMNIRKVRILRLAVKGGVASARNEGIRSASGVFVAITDSDDISDLTRCEKQQALLEKNGADVVSANCIEIDGMDRQFGVKDMPLTHKGIKAMCPFFSPLNNSAVMGRRSVLSLYGYDESLAFGEDYDLWIRLLKNGYIFANHPDRLLMYRKDGQFGTRRRGLRRAKGDFANKISAIGFVPFYVWPGVVAFALLTFMVRMLPPRCVTFAYRARKWANVSAG